MLVDQRWGEGPCAHGDPFGRRAPGQRTLGQGGPIFRTRSGKRVDRTQACIIPRRMAQQANADLPAEGHFQVSPHILRHTLLRNVTHEKGVHDAMELSGHRSDRWI